MQPLLTEQHLLSMDQDVIRIPALVKGQLVVPPPVTRAEILAAFEAAVPDASYVKLPHANAQVIRLPAIARDRMQATPEYVYHLLPRLQPLDLIETDFDALAQGPYALTVDAVLDYLEHIAAALQDNPDVVDRVRDLCRLTSEHPDAYLDAAFATLLIGLDRPAAREMIDRELGAWGLPGSRFLDGWVDLPATIFPGLAPLLAQPLPGAATASQVQFVEGSEAQARAYADCLAEVLGRWDTLAPPFVAPATCGQLKRLQRGKYASADWHINQRGDAYASGVAVLSREFDILDHPMCRLVLVRPVDDLRQALPAMNAAVSTVGVYPEARRLALRDALGARGVSNILPLGECERVYPGAPQDGMLVLSELVDWKNA